MKVNVGLYASLAVHLPEGCSGNMCSLELREGTSIQELLDALNIAHNEPKIMFLNGVHAHLEDILEDGDRFAVFPPIAGG